MNAKPEARSSSSRLPEAVAIVLSLVAVGVSGFSLVEAQRQHQDERATQLLDQIYDDWDQMAAPERWEVSHLDEVPATYDHVRDVLRAYATRLPVQEQRRVYLLERTTAIRILNAFELTLNQWRRAVEIGDADRKAMLDQEVDAPGPAERGRSDHPGRRSSGSSMATGELIRSRGSTTVPWERRDEEWRVRFGDADHYPIAAEEGTD